jgi:hypothetical protein
MSLDILDILAPFGEFGTASDEPPPDPPTQRQPDPSKTRVRIL